MQREQEPVTKLQCPGTHWLLQFSAKTIDRKETYIFTQTNTRGGGGGAGRERERTIGDLRVGVQPPKGVTV